MKLNEYQEAAHSTAVYGGQFNYPIAALAEETGEVLSVWGDWVKNAEYLKVDYSDIRAKLLDEIGDVCWNLAELATLLDVPLEYINKYAESNHVNIATTISYYMCQLSTAVGRVNGTWAKYIRKHDGAQPTVAEVQKEALEGDKTFRSVMTGNCILVFHAINNLITMLEFDRNEVLSHNIEKLAQRKKTNTLGGKGSVDTRSTL